ncbi:hypothetical protein NUW58_g4229 [Xylaria curta]|uniref:Uncharacterized protein n=1 Tax=Xylaria curta TaxID=42375 RepID=A0ACC1PA07_9PEZI|nr:hypothetical protein NUW58_g4229 [Xylaria curta]
MSQSDRQEIARIEEWIQMRNALWRDYRINGTPVYESARRVQQIKRRLALDGVPPAPNPLLFYDHRPWRRKSERYLFNLHGQADDLDRRSHIGGNDPQDALTRKLFKQAQLFFRNERFTYQKALGIGGNGMALHFKDHGINRVNSAGRDFVFKIALSGWQDDGIVFEKKMMRKVKGSAHCVQIIDASEIGKREEPSKLTPPTSYDSSEDDDSSGDESLSRFEVEKRHQTPKVKERDDTYFTKLNLREQERREKIERERGGERKNGKRRRKRRDYIIMEYLQNGTLGDLLVKLNLYHQDHNEDHNIPNRVLWGFWLCLIRACIAMEYPPRKFHPRRRPNSYGSAVSYLQAKANGMLRDLRGLGSEVIYPKEEARLETEYQQLKGDLIENIPARVTREGEGWKGGWKLYRRQNMVHRDLDPTNIFVDGFELDGPAQLHGQANTGDPSGNNYTGKRPDRLDQEHELVPRLKLGDFGLAVTIKKNKTNYYYHALREMGKHGEYPPAMWELITKLKPPTPPQPQPPYEQRDTYPSGSMDDLFIFNEQYEDFKISYCALLLDPEEEPKYDWVHKKLRETIFKCSE